MLGVPLLIRDRLVGTLELTNKRVGAFDADDQRLLETIAPQAAIAIEKAKQVREREQKLKNQIEQLRIEIDEAKRQRQVEQIVETDYFQALRQKARSMREQAKGRKSPTEEACITPRTGFRDGPIYSQLAQYPATRNAAGRDTLRYGLSLLRWHYVGTNDD